MYSFFRYFSYIVHNLLFRLFSISAFMAITLLAQGQDVQLALFRYHPLFVNPAYTGSFIGDWRVGLGYRTQQVVTAEPYQTALAGFDGKLFIFNQEIGAGLYVLNDQSGTGGLTFNKVYGSLAYEKDIDNNMFGIGLQAGFISGKVNNWGLWDNTTGTFTADNGEVYFGERTGFIDINLGMSWKRKIKHILPQAGISLLHLNNPNISFFDGKEKQNILVLFDTRLDWEVVEKITLSPLVTFKLQKGISQSVGGFDINYMLGKRSLVKSVFGGVHLQNGIIENASSVLLQLGTRVKRIDIVLGYEHKLGSFGESTGTTGAFEIGIVYQSISTVLNTYSIPCERL